MLNSKCLRWRFARLSRTRRILTIAALDGTLTREDANFLQPTSGIQRLGERIIRASSSVSAAVALLAATGGEALAGGSGLQIEQSLTPWWQFLTGSLPWYAGTVAIVMGAIVLMYSGLGQGGSRLVSAGAGAVIACGVVVWVMQSLGASQAGLLLP